MISLSIYLYIFALITTFVSGWIIGATLMDLKHFNKKYNGKKQ